MRIRRWSAAAVAAALALTGCSTESADPAADGGHLAACATDPASCNSGRNAPGGVLTYGLGKDVKSWNTLSSNGNTVEYAHAMAGMVPYVSYFAPDLKWTVNADLMHSVRLVGTSPQVVEYRIRPEAVWSDGAPIGAADFQWMWRVLNTRDCPACPAASTSGYQDIARVDGSDGGKTVRVAFQRPYPDWQGLFPTLRPAHLIRRHGDLAAGFHWLEKTVPTWSGGPYRVERYEPNFALNLVPNERYYGPRPSLERVVFRIVTNDAEVVPALRNRELSVINPIVTPDMIEQVREVPDVHHRLSKSLSWEHLDLNLRNPALADRALRRAIFTAVDRKAIIAKTAGQYAPDTEPLGSHHFVPGMAAYRDYITPTGQGSGDLAKARKILADAGYRGGDTLTAPGGAPVPALRMRHTVGNQLRKNTCELVAATLKQLGIQVRIEPTDNLGATLAGGDFDIMIFAWVTTPLRIGSAYQLWHSRSASNYGKWVNRHSDALLARANGIVADDPKAHALLNQAGAAMADDAYVLPLFQRESFLAVADGFVNIRPNPSIEGSAYNIGQWGAAAR